MDILDQVVFVTKGERIDSLYILDNE